MKPILYIVIPCFNEEKVLPLTAPMFKDKLVELIKQFSLSEKSRILFVNDGSVDTTWQIISSLCKNDEFFCGISLSKNYGHQNALLAGLMEAKDKCDVTISIDCDGQDDLDAMNDMIKEYLSGCEIVYGVRSARDTDTVFKRTTAQNFYEFLKVMGAKTVYNHADYRLISSKALNELSKFKEVNIYLRGMVPMIGFKSTSVYYKRGNRLAGKGHYPLKKMFSLALDGITSLSIKPIRLITSLGFIIVIISFIGVIWSVVTKIMGKSVAGWSSIVSIICMLGGIQILSIGVIGEYIGKIYLETKRRPRYIIEEKTE
ncbi:MAG: glycosyltransferase family 2 protein [Clostridia bacterium]|nr:glycosyltransferase family 2 protein [Clostridia bacterium]